MKTKRVYKAQGLDPPKVWWTAFELQQDTTSMIIQSGMTSQVGGKTGQIGRTAVIKLDWTNWNGIYRVFWNIFVDFTDDSVLQHQLFVLLLTKSAN